LTDYRDLQEQIDDLITAVYRTRTVNPWLGARERADQLERLFRERLPEYPLRNQTDAIFGGSTALAFLLHPGYYMGVPTRDGLESLINRLGGACFMALIEISHLGPYARVRFTRETFDRGTGVLDYAEQETPYRDEDMAFLGLLLELLADEGIEVLPKEILDMPVPDVELDVTEPGCATVYHCLFDEE
jgi:hypothetical protein